MTYVNAEKVKNVMEMARTQNVTDGADRDGFTAKLYLGLKKGKVRRSGGSQNYQSGNGGIADPRLQKLLEDPDSSSEDEYVEDDGEEMEGNESSVTTFPPARRCCCCCCRCCS